MENEKLTPQQQREKILRDALWKMVDHIYIDDRMVIYKDAIIAADAIPDVPKCPNCGPLGNDFCTWKGHWTMDSGSISEAPVAYSCPCGDTGRPGHPEGTCGSRKPVPSRAELIELMCGAWSAEFSVSIDRLHMTRVLDALIKAGVVKL